MKRCITTKAKRTTCTVYAERKTSAVTRVGGVSKTNVLNWQGFPSPGMASVGRLVMGYSDGGVGKCTGTVVTRTLVITAAHCVVGNVTQILFIPGQYWDGSGNPAMPYGYWEANQWWTHGTYASSKDPGLDFALIEFGPHQQWLGDVTGAWTITPNINYNGGAREYIVGYPSDGFWETKAGSYGQAQYACDSTYEKWEAAGSGYLLWASCTMNRGSSGGPWFVQLSDGSWTIGAVTSQCSAPDNWKNPEETGPSYCWPYSQHSRGAFFNEDFYEFWTSVQPLLKW